MIDHGVERSKDRLQLFVVPAKAGPSDFQHRWIPHPLSRVLKAAGMTEA
jgi:hypothetical protein